MHTSLQKLCSRNFPSCNFFFADEVMSHLANIKNTQALFLSNKLATTALTLLKILAKIEWKRMSVIPSHFHRVLWIEFTEPLACHIIHFTQFPALHCRIGTYTYKSTIISQKTHRSKKKSTLYFVLCIVHRKKKIKGKRNGSCRKRKCYAADYEKNYSAT